MESGDAQYHLPQAARCQRDRSHASDIRQRLWLINTPIPALFDEVAFSLGQTVEIVPYALSGSPELVNNVAGKLSNNANAYILQNHGILALGKNLDKAILHAELLEKVAHIYYLALSTGKPINTLPESIVEVVETVRNNEVKAGNGRKSK